MVKSQDLVPSIYYKESRDFQYFGRLFDIIFNYAKTNIDLLRGINYKKNSNLIDLLMQTLGFYFVHDNKIDSLSQLSSIWINLIKNKGTEAAVTTLIKSILNHENIKTEIDVSYTGSDTSEGYNKLDIRFTRKVPDTDLFLIESALDYILPVTVIYELHKASVKKVSEPYIISMINSASVFSISPTDRVANDNQTMIITPRASSGDQISEEIDPISQGDLRFSRVAKDEEGK